MKMGDLNLRQKSASELVDRGAPTPPPRAAAVRASMAPTFNFWKSMLVRSCAVEHVHRSYAFTSSIFHQKV